MSNFKDVAICKIENVDDNIEVDIKHIKTEVDENKRLRVKLYKLNSESEWTDIGIGHVSTCYVHQLNVVFLMVNSEADNALLLLCKIQSDTDYKKQLGHFIMWTEEDTVLGLSFEENAGCDQIWETICQAQGKDPSVENTQDVDEDDDVEDTKEDIENRERWFEEMLDFDQVELSSKERHAVEQLIDRVNGAVREDIEPTEGLKELHKNLLYLLMLNRKNE